MSEPQSTIDFHTTRYEYDDGWTVAVDLGTPAVDDTDVSVDSVGETAVVSLETATLTTEFDVDLPEAEYRTRIRNGVLVVEGTEEETRETRNE
ncbi:hypothetical protein SAMN04487948_107125 [Halogranum amylolyticum]|uniref:Hsp20/alpha crystallin family protein n=1 Tax=Halogranum amylolyticum TaxID=660520 RepID=A0A1H8TL21_9EURY|nr:hypothetical protein [Halogranum amylolyticum]SEO91274.1 hypothetical protein SAMN04487948_107125 [Halogranum amylolyticum]